MTTTALSSTLPTATSTAAKTTDREKLSAVAKQFEAVFVRQMLAAARQTKFGDDLFGGQAMQTFRQMQDDHLADVAAETGALGFATMIEAQIARFLPPESASAAAPATGAKA